MKKILKMLLIFLIVVLIKLVSTFMINGIIIFNYNHGIYNSMLVKSLYFLNISEPYIAYYNEGNIMYKKKDYDGAIKKYKEAISLNPPHDKVCDVRINLAMAMINNIDINNYNEAYDTLEEAIYVLYKDKCAGIDGDNKEAQELEAEIEQLKEELNNNSNEKNNTEKKEPEEEESEVEEELKEIEKNSNGNRQEELNEYENMGGDYYSGKNW
ncbi:MAG: tetratricopeptide repeat protein [Bacilli bacterium]|nr:tetratricopeptide repeat protein [Bacilli bacterium]